MNKQVENINNSEIKPSSPNSVSTAQCKSCVSIHVPWKVRYMNPLTDHEFKYIFSNCIAVKDFLNDVLQFEDKIISVKHNKIKKKIKEKDPYFNLLCVTSRGENMIIEMRNLAPPTLIGGGLYFDSVPIYCEWSDGLKYTLNIVSILNEKDDVDDTRPYRHKVQIINRENLRISDKELAFEFEPKEQDLQQTMHDLVQTKQDLAQAKQDLDAERKKNEALAAQIEDLKKATNFTNYHE